MVKVFQNTDNEFYMDGYLQDNIEKAKKVIQKDWDMVFAVDGVEGGGKSVFAQQIAFYCDPTLNIDRIVFTPHAFRKAIMESEPYQAVVYDEAYTGLSSRATMSLINRTLVSMLAEIRQKNLFVFVVMPTFFDLDKYVAIWRSRALFHIYTNSDFQRGFFCFYNMKVKKYLYIEGKKYYSYKKPRPNFFGRFTNHYVVDETAYRKKKKDSLTEREKKREDKEKKLEIDAAVFERVMLLGEGIPHSTKIKLLGMPASTYYIRLKKWREGEDM